MDSKRIVITGINGFVGHHLAHELVAHDVEVIGLGQDGAVASNLRDTASEYHAVNLIDKWPIIENVDAIIHLAGLAAVGPSFDNPQQYIDSNSSMVTNMCEYYLKQDKKPRIIVVSSGAVYNSNQEMPITEDSQVGFSSPYAVSKILTENQCSYYRGRGLDCITVRPFNHIGPGQTNGFLVPDIAMGLKNAKQNSTALSVGNLASKRDYTDVRDVVKAYYSLVSTPTLNHTVYNVCSGVSTSGNQILELIQNTLAISDVLVEIDQAKIRPNDPPDIYGSSERLQSDTGWKPVIPLGQTIKDYVSHLQ